MMAALIVSFLCCILFSRISDPGTWTIVAITWGHVCTHMKLQMSHCPHHSIQGLSIIFSVFSCSFSNQSVWSYWWSPPYPIIPLISLVLTPHPSLRLMFVSKNSITSWLGGYVRNNLASSATCSLDLMPPLCWDLSESSSWTRRGGWPGGFVL